METLNVKIIIENTLLDISIQAHYNNNNVIVNIHSSM